MPCWKAIRRRSFRSRYRPTAQHWLRHRGIRPCGCGRSQAARRACSKGILRTSTALRSLPTAARWSASATIRAFGSGRLSGASAPTVVALPTPLNAVAIGGDGEIVAGGADGKLYFLARRRHRTRRNRRRAATGDLDCDLAGWRAGGRRKHWRIGGGDRAQDARSRAHAGRPRAAGLVGRVPAR